MQRITRKLFHLNQNRRVRFIVELYLNIESMWQFSRHTTATKRADSRARNKVNKIKWHKGNRNIALASITMLHKQSEVSAYHFSQKCIQ